jgi:hypothetical protein
MGGLAVLNTVVVALDGSDLSEQVIQILEELQLQPTTKSSFPMSFPHRS